MRRVSNVSPCPRNTHSDPVYYYGLCVLTKNIGRRLSLELQCSYQGQQSDVGQTFGTLHKKTSPVWKHFSEFEPTQGLYNNT